MNSNLNIFNHPYLSDESFITFRDDAFRKYLGLPERQGHNLYVDNGNGTWSYNMDYINKVRRENPTMNDLDFYYKDVLMNSLRKKGLPITTENLRHESTLIP